MQIQVKLCVLEEGNTNFSGITINLEMNLCNCFGFPYVTAHICNTPKVGPVRMKAMISLCNSCHITALFVFLIIKS